jgi:hypothetical protein
MTNHTSPTPVNATAALANAARRLRYLRRAPNPFTYQSNNEQIKLGMAYAYEYALRVVIDEFSAQENFHALFYGPQSEDSNHVWPSYLGD